MLANHSFTYRQLTERTEAHMRDYLSAAAGSDDIAAREGLHASVRSLFILWTGLTNDMAKALIGDAKQAFDADQGRLLEMATAGLPSRPHA
jgi:hypothetical protein